MAFARLLYDGYTSIFRSNAYYRPRTGHVFRRQAAGTLSPDLAKKLSQLVKMEKNVMRSMELVSRERMEVAVSFLILVAFLIMRSRY